MVFFCLSVLLFCSRASALQEYVWTNTLGGSWHNALNWSPHGVPGVFGDNVYITNTGTYTVVITNTVTHIDSGVIGGSSGTQTLRVQDGATFNGGFWNVQSNGLTIFTNSAFSGILYNRTNGHVVLTGAGQKTFTGVTIYNWGTIQWDGGPLLFVSAAFINNYGLWQIATDNLIQFGGSQTVWTNIGVLRKISGGGETRIGIITFVNTASGLVDAQSGFLNFYGSTTNLLGGTFNAAAGGTNSFTEGTWFSAGGTCTGAGLNQFYGGTLNLRTNIIPGLKLVANNVVLGTNFQQAGAITNLTLDGATLVGTNRVGAGTLRVNSGSLGTRLTVQAGGQLLLATSTAKNFPGLTLINQGTVNWTGGTIAIGSGAISNGGLWQIQSDDQLYTGGGASVPFTNSGTLRKIAGSSVDMTRIDGFNFVNLTSGVVQVDAGTLRMPQNYTNAAGTLHLNGGTLGASSGAFFGFGPLYMTGGTLDGVGAIDQNVIVGGTISPGSSPGLIQFRSGLNLNAGSILSIDGTGTIPGSGYDQLSVTGAVAISNCTLQVTSLPVVPVGTTFVIITNNDVSAVQGTFAGLPENALVSLGAQTFRVHYGGGNGNDVTLVKDSDVAPFMIHLSSGGYSNGSFSLSGTGMSTMVYTIQATTNFIQWTNIGAVTSSAGGSFSFTDTNAALFRYRFYRPTN